MRPTLLLAGACLLTGIVAPAHGALMKPDIDDGDYAELLGELQNRLPDYAPEWTEHNESDRGATLLDLIAFTPEDLGYRISTDDGLDDLLWDDFDAEDESTLGEVAYLMLDAAYLARHGTGDNRPAGWLDREGINPAWTYTELRSAAVRSVPEPAPMALLAAGVLLLTLARRFGVRRLRDGST